MRLAANTANTTHASLKARESGLLQLYSWLLAPYLAHLECVRHASALSIPRQSMYENG